jgi:DNA repair protein RadC
MKTKTFTFYVKERAISKKIIESPREVYKRMKNLTKADQESFWVIAFNHSNKEIYHECLFIGGIAQVVVDPIIIFKRLFTIGASSFIVVHNHPGGNCIPSDNDKSTTDKIKDISKIVGIKLLDHIIISDDGYYSFSNSLSW